MGGARAAELRLGDLEIFLQIVRAGTVNGAARSLGVSPSHVSKAAARLEAYVGVELLARSALGVMPTDAGQRLVPTFVDLVARAASLSQPTPSRELTLVAPAFLSSHFVPLFAARLRGWRLHALEPPPVAPGAYATQAVFDVALTTREERWPDSWMRSRAGVVRRALFAAPALARRLGARPRAAQLADEVFIGPIYSDRGQLLPSDDGCPMPASQRRFGHRTQTVALALALAAQGEQLVFAPVLAARAAVAAGQLVEVAVEGWQVRDPVYLLCHQDRVAAQVQRALLGIVSRGLKNP